MKVTCDAGDLLSALSRCSIVVDREGRNPILSTVLFEMEGSNLLLSGTDLAVTISNSVPISDVGTPIKFAIKHYALKQWLTYSARAKDNVIFDIGENKTKGRCGKNTAEFNHFDSEMFPIIDAPSGKLIVEIPGKDFVSITQNVADLASTKAHHETFCHVKMRVKDGLFEMVATDGAAFGWQKASVRDSDAEVSLLVHHKAILAVEGALRKYDKITIRADDRTVFFEAPSCYAYTRIGNQKYPEVAPFLNEDHKNKALVAVSVLIDALRASIGFSKEDQGSAAKIGFEPEHNLVSIGSPYTEIGENESIINANRIIGEKASFHVNIDYLLNILGKIETLECWLHYEEQEDGTPKPLHVSDTEGKQRYLLAGIAR